EVVNALFGQLLMALHLTAELLLLPKGLLAHHLLPVELLRLLGLRSRRKSKSRTEAEDGKVNGCLHDALLWKVAGAATTLRLLPDSSVSGRITKKVACAPLMARQRGEPAARQQRPLPF